MVLHMLKNHVTVPCMMMLQVNLAHVGQNLSWCAKGAGLDLVEKTGVYVWLRVGMAVHMSVT